MCIYESVVTLYCDKMNAFVMAVPTKDILVVILTLEPNMIVFLKLVSLVHSSQVAVVFVDGFRARKTYSCAILLPS